MRSLISPRSKMYKSSRYCSLTVSLRYCLSKSSPEYGPVEMMIGSLPKNSLPRRPVREVVEGFNADIRAGGIVPVFKLAAIYREKVAIHDSYGKHTYRDLFEAAAALSRTIIEKIDGQRQKNIAYLCPGDSTHVVTQWAIWMSGNVAVPLSPAHPLGFLEYFLEDTAAILSIVHESLVKKLPASKKEPFILPTDLLCKPTSPEIQTWDLSSYPDANFYANSNALIVYTSGTTNKPKGVLYSFKTLAAQIAALHAAWHYKYTDVVLHTLPLHHVHGAINSSMASLAVGATLRMIKFDSTAIWNLLLNTNKNGEEKITVFMGVPTMYVRLIEEYNNMLNKTKLHKEYIRTYMSRNLRLMISGSAPLPIPVFENWEEISGHRLLERYGMSEFGMGLSNPYKPMAERSPGYVGVTFPGMSAKIVFDDANGLLPIVTLHTPAPKLEIDLKKNNFLIEADTNVRNLFNDDSELKKLNPKCEVIIHNTKEPNKSGDLLIRGPSLFKEYWQKPELTKKEFTNDGWFKTGDTAVFENGKVKLLGRTSIDIIKSGGYKISALSLETVLVGHEAIADIAILGMPDLTWGEKVTAVVELKPGATLTLPELKKWAVDYLPNYQLPSELVVSKIPRNAMGKIDKKELKQTLLKMKP